MTWYFDPWWRKWIPYEILRNPIDKLDYYEIKPSFLG